MADELPAVRDGALREDQAPKPSATEAAGDELADLRAPRVFRSGPTYAGGHLQHVVAFANRTDERREVALLDFLAGWPVHHLGEMDRQYADHMLRMGVE